MIGTIFWRRVGMILPAAWMLLAASPAQAITPKDFLQSPAASAFKAGDFEAALDNLHRLLESHPDDVLLLRYLGITLDRLGRSSEAIAAFDRALAVAPDNAALHFFRGVAQWHAGDYRGAGSEMAAVRRLAPDSPYATKAEEYLAAAEAQRANLADAEPGRPWDLRLRGGLQYDSNVPLGPPGFDDGGFRFFEALDGGYDLLSVDGFVLRGEAFGYLSQQLESDIQDYDAQIFEPALEASHSTTLWGLPVGGALRYAYNMAFLEGSTFSRSHELTTSLRARPDPAALTQVSHQVSFDSFADDGFDSEVSSRDGITNAIGVTQYLFCCEQRYYLYGGYEYLMTDAEGDNFDSRGHSFSLGGSAALPFELRFDVSGQYVIEIYPDFVSIEDRETHRTSVTAALSREIIEGLAITLSYSYTNEDSNFDDLEYERQIATMAATYRF